MVEKNPNILVRMASMDNYKLPILSINSMSEGQLRDFIPTLLTMVKSQMDDKTSKPDWWPNDLPWTDTQTHIRYQQASWVDTLRDVVRCCYRHLGQEKLLQESSKDKIKTSQNSTLPTSLSPTMLACLQKTKVVPSPEKKLLKESRRRYSEIFVCFFCEKEFLNKSEMRAHQIICDDRPPELHAVSTPNRDLSPREGTLPPQMSPVKVPVSDQVIRLTKDQFIKKVGLVQKQKAARIIERHRCNSMDIDCNLDLDEPDTPISPPTPRTPKSLISQLSKDDSYSSSRKRLSYSHDNSMDKESVISSGSNDEERPSHANKSLLNIDVTSLLGHRVLKYMKDETNLVILKDTEIFCRTPDKNEYYDKLRNRSNQYPIFYRPRKCFDLFYSHQYKFTRKQKRESIKKSRRKPVKLVKRSVTQKTQPCKVMLKALTKKDLKKWLPKCDVKKVTDEIFFDENNNDLFPQVPILNSKECDKLLGLKKRSLRSLNKADPLSLTNVISEDDNAEVSKQKLTLYKCLLTEINGPKWSKPKPRWSSSKYRQFKAKDDKELMFLKNESALAQAIVEKHLTDFMSDRVSDRVVSTTSIEDFSVRRNDDNISILSLSTSEDESYNSQCCLECRRKTDCACSPLVVSPHISNNKQVKAEDIPVNDKPSTKALSPQPVLLPILSCPVSTPQKNTCCCASTNIHGDTFINTLVLPSPPPSTEKKSFGSKCSDSGSDGHSVDLENSLASKRTSPYKLRVSSPRKTFPDFELFLHRKSNTVALGERTNNHWNQSQESDGKAEQVMTPETGKSKILVSSASQPSMDMLRRSKRIRSPTMMCSGSPAKLRKLETRY